VGSNFPGYEQRELRLLVWKKEGDHQILKQTASLEFQSSLPDQRFGKAAQQFSTRFIVKQNGHTTFFGNAVSSSAERQRTLSIFPQAPRPASLRPMKSEMRWNEGETFVTTDGTMMPKRVEVFEKYAASS